MGEKKIVHNFGARSVQNVARRDKYECVYNIGTKSIEHVAGTGEKNCT